MRPKDFSSPNCREDFTLTMPYTTQCALVIWRALQPTDACHRQLLDYLQQEGRTPDSLTLNDINLITRCNPGLVAGSDSANPGFPQTLANLWLYRKKSAMGRIFLEAVYAVTGHHKVPVCCFIRAKGTTVIKSGPYKGRLTRDNYVLHDSQKIHRHCPEDTLMKVRLADHGLVYVQTRVTFVKALVEVWNG